MPVDDVSGGGDGNGTHINTTGDVNVAGCGDVAGGGDGANVGGGELAVTGRDTRGRQNAVWIKDVAVSARVRQAVLNMEAWRVEVR